MKVLSLGFLDLFRLDPEQGPFWPSHHRFVTVSDYSRHGPFCQSLCQDRVISWRPYSLQRSLSAARRSVGLAVSFRAVALSSATTPAMTRSSLTFMRRDTNRASPAAQQENEPIQRRCHLSGTKTKYARMSLGRKPL
ncbi:hypothetical protein BN1723_003016 [Verticillium longisporum]|uniref:Uncharacterized protein n=1 Tax=Verticillium longisporum TaxID=100787 RepID=A0A0G4LMN0_VERLO|nr:hypothetical protein BN1723_003016 [Verticillium longisporum]